MYIVFNSEETIRKHTYARRKASFEKTTVCKSNNKIMLFNNLNCYIILIKIILINTRNLYRGKIDFNNSYFL